MHIPAGMLRGAEPEPMLWSTSGEQTGGLLVAETLSGLASRYPSYDIKKGFGLGFCGIGTLNAVSLVLPTV